MIIAFDATQLATRNISGVAVYTIELINALAEKYPNDHFVGFYGNRVGNTSSTKNLPCASNISYKRIFIPLQLLYTLRRIGVKIPIEILVRRWVDVAIYPNFLGYGKLRGSVKNVHVVHDLTYVYFPESMANRFLSDLKSMLQKQLKQASIILTPSRSSAIDIHRTLSVPLSKILVTTIPLAATKSSDSNTTKRSKNKILYIGTIEPRKNLENLIYAFNIFLKTNKEMQLIVVGQLGWNATYNTKVLKLMNSNRSIIYRGYVSEIEKWELLKTARIFILPSYYEGYGIPIIEAAACSTPVAVSNISVFHELCDDHGWYFDPSRPSDIAQTIQNMVRDDQLMQRRARQLNNTVMSMGWSQVASKIYDRFKQY